MPISQCNAAGFQILLGLALIVCSLVMLTPRPPQPELLSFAQADKLVHLAAFALLGGLADAGWPQRAYNYRKYLPLLGYGLLIECLQHFIPQRSFDLFDLLADAAGLLCYGILLLPLLRRLRLR